MRTIFLALLLAFTPPARADTPVKESVGIAFIAAGVVGGVLSYALVLQNPSAPDYPEQRAAGWSAVGFCGAAVVSGILAITVPPRSPFRRRASLTPTGMVLHF